MAGEESESGERSEEATAQRREDFRKQGQVAQSREIVSVAMLFGTVLLIWAAGKFFLTQFHEVFQTLLGPQMASAVRQGDLFPLIRYAGEKVALITVPFLLVTVLISFFATLLQTGFLVKEDAFEMKLDLLNPINGFKRMFSARAGIEGLKSFLKMTLIIVIVYFTIKSEVMHSPLLMSFSAEQLFTHLFDVSGKLVMSIGVFMLVLAVADYAYQRWELERRMRMTKQEVKEEFKSREGDPQIKARIRKIQRDVAQRRMMDAVPKADVIVTNPTHIAVALKYDANLPAPQLVAKGADLIAEKIKEIAKANNIPIVENVPLARTIFKTMKIGQVIPRELFNAVAEVLAYVFKLKRKVLR